MARQRMDISDSQLNALLEAFQDVIMSPQMNSENRDAIKIILQSVDVIDVNDPDISAFVLTEQTGAATIDDTEETIAIEVAALTDVTDLTPTVTIPAGCAYSPTGSQDFTKPVEYTVTNQDGGCKIYTVTVTIAE